MAGDINHVTLVGTSHAGSRASAPSLRTARASTRSCCQREAEGRDGQLDRQAQLLRRQGLRERGGEPPQHLAKGRRIGVDGRLDWSSWEAQDGSKRSKVEVVAFQVQFLDSRGDGGGDASSPTPQYVPAGDVEPNTSDFTPSATDDDIPF